MAKRFRLYRNLHKGCFSVQEYIKGKGYRVVDHIEDGYLIYNCTFKVYESGRQKVLRDLQKNVHAYVQFDNYAKMDIVSKTKEQPYYNPYKVDSFVSSTTQEKLTEQYNVVVKQNQLYLCSK